MWNDTKSSLLELMKEDGQLQNILTSIVQSEYVQLEAFCQDLSNMMNTEGLWLLNDLSDS